ncbi:hypothetical protein C8F01DRAFT_1115583 [Mycena amicta]|nr:hypothetical protein C8F01DRAFT_1115583 [Mycena amicta]
MLDDEYYVEYIVKSRVKLCDGVKFWEHLVNWASYPDQTWEPESSFWAVDFLERYWTAHSQYATCADVGATFTAKESWIEMEKAEFWRTHTKEQVEGRVLVERIIVPREQIDDDAQSLRILVQAWHAPKPCTVAPLAMHVRPNDRCGTVVRLFLEAKGLLDKYPFPADDFPSIPTVSFKGVRMGNSLTISQALRDDTSEDIFYIHHLTPGEGY